MMMRSLIITGDKDINPDFSERADWRADAYKAYTRTHGP